VVLVIRRQYGKRVVVSVVATFSVCLARNLGLSSSRDGWVGTVLSVVSWRGRLEGRKAAGGKSRERCEDRGRQRRQIGVYAQLAFADARARAFKLRLYSEPLRVATTKTQQISVAVCGVRKERGMAMAMPS